MPRAPACDCHVHVIGAQARYPMTPARRYTPGLASVAMLRTHLASVGMRRVVVVQPSVYGTDNRCLLDSLAALGDAARGVAVPPENAPAQLLCQMHAQGVRGVRVNLESCGARDASSAYKTLAHWSARIADLGWHVQLYAAFPVIAALAPRLASLPTPVVLDHFALPDGTRHAQAVVAFLRSENIYVKLSAPYRLVDAHAAARYAQVFLDAAAHRVLWGSDWPHTARAPGKHPHAVSPYRAVGSTALMETLHAWLPTPTLRRKVLAENPASLYGF